MPTASSTGRAAARACSGVVTGNFFVGPVGEVTGGFAGVSGGSDTSLPTGASAVAAPELEAVLEPVPVLESVPPLEPSGTGTATSQLIVRSGSFFVDPGLGGQPVPMTEPRENCHGPPCACCTRSTPDPLLYVVAPPARSRCPRTPRAVASRSTSVRDGAVSQRTAASDGPLGRSAARRKPPGARAAAAGAW